MFYQLPIDSSRWSGLLFWSSQNFGSTLAEYPSESSWANGPFPSPEGVQEAIHPNVGKALWREVHEKLTLAVVTWFLKFDTFWIYGWKSTIASSAPNKFLSYKKEWFATIKLLAKTLCWNGQAWLFRVVGMVWWGEWLPTFHTTKTRHAVNRFLWWSPSCGIHSVW